MFIKFFLIYSLFLSSTLIFSSEVNHDNYDKLMNKIYTVSYYNQFFGALDSQHQNTQIKPHSIADALILEYTTQQVDYGLNHDELLFSLLENLDDLKSNPTILSNYTLILLFNLIYRVNNFSKYQKSIVHKILINFINQPNSHLMYVDGPSPTHVWIKFILLNDLEKDHLGILMKDIFFWLLEHSYFHSDSLDCMRTMLEILPYISKKNELEKIKTQFLQSKLKLSIGDDFVLNIISILVPSKAILILKKAVDLKLFNIRKFLIFLERRHYSISLHSFFHRTDVIDILSQYFFDYGHSFTEKIGDFRLFDIILKRYPSLLLGKAVRVKKINDLITKEQIKKIERNAYYFSRDEFSPHRLLAQKLGIKFLTKNFLATNASGLIPSGQENSANDLLSHLESDPVGFHEWPTKTVIYVLSRLEMGSTMEKIFVLLSPFTKEFTDEKEVSAQLIRAMMHSPQFQLYVCNGEKNDLLPCFHFIPLIKDPKKILSIDDGLKLNLNEHHYRYLKRAFKRSGLELKNEDFVSCTSSIETKAGFGVALGQPLDKKGIKNLIPISGTNEKLAFTYLIALNQGFKIYFKEQDLSKELIAGILCLKQAGVRHDMRNKIIGFVVLFHRNDFDRLHMPQDAALISLFKKVGRLLE